MANKYSFQQGDLVRVRGLAGEHRVNQMVLLQVPSIERFKFVMVEREMARLTYGKESYCAWASDLTKIDLKGRKR